MNRIADIQPEDLAAPVVDARNLRKAYGDHVVIDDVSLQVRSGEVLAILGPSGAGKSTLLRMLNHLETPDAGDILIDGQSIVYQPNAKGGIRVPLREKHIADVRRGVSMVFQQFNLYPHLTALENVAVAPIKVLKRDRKACLALAEEMLVSVGLGDRLDAYPEQLSGGQQQRVGIARALAMKPRAILFDEPTSALDPETVGDVLQIMVKLAREGMTMVVVTHELNFAKAAASRVIFFDKGVITEEAEPDRFFSAPSHPRTQQFLGRMLA
jgi:polar amino acid transport system ATP-binding protein